jgi:hypothetical protein
MNQLRKINMLFTHWKMVSRFFCWLGISSLLVGCTLIQLREETKIAKTSIILVGTISSKPSFSEMPVVVAAYSKNGGKRTIVHYAMLHEPGPYELILSRLVIRTKI